MALLAWHTNWHLDAGVLLLAIILDLVLPEPPNAVHPVAWMGKAIAALERLADGRGKTAALIIGAGIAVGLPIVVGSVAWLATAGLRELGSLPYLIGGAILLKTTFSVRGLAAAASETQRAIEADAVSAARQSLRSLVSRDAGTLSKPLVAAAAIESVAENTADSYIAPWLAFALFGLPGAFAYRAINTLDSMIGYRGRYEYLGKASARLDDFANLAPARIAAALLILAGAVFPLTKLRGAAETRASSGGVRTGWRIAIRQHRLTASPNAGWTIAAMSGLLGVALEKPCHYRIGAEFGAPTPSHIGAAVRLAYITAALGMITAVAAIAARTIVAG